MQIRRPDVKIHSSVKVITMTTKLPYIVFNISNYAEYCGNESDTWFAKNLGGAVRSVHVTADPVENVVLLKNYQGEWRKA